MHTGEKTYNGSDKSLGEEYKLNCKVAEAINTHNTGALSEKTQNYFKQLHKHNISDKHHYKSRIESLNVLKVVGRMLLLAIGLPVFVAGVIGNYPPYFIAQKFAKKKVKHIEFYASIYFAFSMIGWIAYCAIQLFILRLFLANGTWLIAYIGGVIITGLISIKYYRLYKDICAERRLLQLTRKSPEVVTELLLKRQDITTSTEKMLNK